MRGKTQRDEGNFRLQIKARHWETRERGREQRGGADGLKIDPDSGKGVTLPFLRQMDTFLWVVRKDKPAANLRRQKSGRFQSHSCPRRKNL